MPREKEALEAALAVEFQDRALLQQALTHRSILNENPEVGFPSNERLEFLGDAIIDYLAAEYLFRRFPNLQEGELTALRAALVRTESLAALAARWELGEYLVMGKGEEQGGGRTREANLCATFEALIGALYLDSGLPAVRQLVEPLLAEQVGRLLAEAPNESAWGGAPKDAKSRLQELAQSRFHITPSYRLAAQSGPDHDKQFTAEVLIGASPRGSGVGRTKQLAEQAAAQAALQQLEAEESVKTS
jgi:ribonuclease-3